MIAKARAKYIRISPRKVRQVVELIRGKGIDEASAILANINKSATIYIEEVLQSAINNAQRKNSELSPADLYIAKFTVDGGPTMVRYRAASMGRAVMIRHRTSHLNVELDIKAKVQKEIKKSRKAKVKK